ncbi:MAG TPA: hypothetical protein VE871_10760 [Longimicrobium sp.]|nr:hypothetical protein [Longimicrobium sp.]
MELDEMKQSWQAYDRKLDASLELNAHLLRITMLGRAQTAVGRLSWLLAVELLGALAALVWLVSFTVRHAGEARFAVPGAMLGLCALALAITAGRQFAVLRELDYGQPVLAIQSRLEALRLERLRGTLVALVLGPLLWVPALIVLVKGVLGVDAYVLFSQAWILANVLFGGAVLAGAVWASRRYADRMERSPRLQRLMRDLAGHNVNHAIGFVEELRRFGREPGSA